MKKRKRWRPPLQSTCVARSLEVPPDESESENLRTGSAAWTPGMTLRAKGARKHRGNSPRPKEEGTVTVGSEAGRERRLISGHLGAPTRAAVHREGRAPAAGSRAFIQ